MASITIHVENTQTGKNANAPIPVNGQKQTFGTLYGANLGKPVISTDVFVKDVGAAQNVKITVESPSGNAVPLNSNGTPYRFDNGQPKDVTDWYLVAEQK